VETKVHCFQAVVDVAQFPHMESRYLESYIQNHHYHLLMPWVETIGEGKSVMIIEKAPKVHQYYHMDYTAVEEI